MWVCPGGYRNKVRYQSAHASAVKHYLTSTGMDRNASISECLDPQWQGYSWLFTIQEHDVLHRIVVDLGLV
jgi:hypothetical protein